MVSKNPMTLLATWKNRKRESEFSAGYDWAAGSLLRGEQTPYSIESICTFQSTHYFDRGALVALDHLIRRAAIVDDRVVPHPTTSA